MLGPELKLWTGTGGFLFLLLALLPAFVGSVRLFPGIHGDASCLASRRYIWLSPASGTGHLCSSWASCEASSLPQVAYLILLIVRQDQVRRLPEGAG